jgi:hypothetical protein
MVARATSRPPGERQDNKWESCFLHASDLISNIRRVAASRIYGGFNRQGFRARMPAEGFRPKFLRPK